MTHVVISTAELQELEGPAGLEALLRAKGLRVRLGSRSRPELEPPYNMWPLADGRGWEVFQDACACGLGSHTAGHCPTCPMWAQPNAAGGLWQRLYAALGA